MAITGGRSPLPAAAVGLALCLLCTLECTGLATYDGAAEEPTDDTDSMLKMSEEVEEKEQLNQNTELDPIPAPRADLADPAADPYSYQKTQGVVIREELTSVKSTDEKPFRVCQRTCNENAACKGFSFKPGASDPSEAKCYITRYGFVYHWGWNLYARGVKVDSRGAEIPSEKFHEFPGMTTNNILAVFPASGADKEQMLLENCQEKCQELSKGDNHKCQSYSYCPDRQKCILSEERINYDPEWAYYENKQRVHGDPAERPNDTKVRKQLERVEASAARKAKKARLEREWKRQEAENEESSQAMVQKETKRKQRAQERTKEMQHKMDERQRLQTKRMAAAEEQGKYQASVQEAEENEAYAEARVFKETAEKEKFGSMTRVKKEKEKKKEEEREVQDMKTQKRMSLNTVALAEAKKVRKQLMVREQILAVYSRAKLLATEQRLSTGRELPGEQERLHKEKMYVKKKTGTAIKTAEINHAAQKVESKITAAEAQSKNQIKSLQTMYKGKLAELRAREETRLQKARKAAKKARIQAKMKQLKEKREGANSQEGREEVSK